MTDQSTHVSHVFAGALVTAVQQLEALEKECAALRQERDTYRADRDSHQRGAIDAGLQLNAVREDARMWMDRYSNLFVRVACGVPPDITTAGVFLSWQREIDAAYEAKK